MPKARSSSLSARQAANFDSRSEEFLRDHPEWNLPPPHRFHELFSKIATRFETPKKKKVGSTSYISSASRLKRDMYRAGLAIDKCGFDEALFDHAAAIKTPRGGDRSSVFGSIIVIMKPLIRASGSSLSKYAFELNLAHQNNIDPNCLDVFLAMIGGYHGIRRQGIGVIKEKWVEPLKTNFRSLDQTAIG